MFREGVKKFLWLKKATLRTNMYLWLNIAILKWELFAITVEGGPRN
jgi:hypothetical protein